MIYHNTYNPDNDAARNIIKNYDPLSSDNVSGYNNLIKGIDNYDSGINLKLIENIANTEKCTDNTMTGIVIAVNTNFNKMVVKTNFKHLVKYKLNIRYYADKSIYDDFSLFLEEISGNDSVIYKIVSTPDQYDSRICVLWIHLLKRPFMSGSIVCGIDLLTLDKITMEILC